MSRADRYIQPGCLCHLTHRCHDRKFLFRFAVTRDEYRERLRVARRAFGVSLLNYCVTSNHTHLLAEAPAPASSIIRGTGDGAAMTNWSANVGGTVCWTSSAS